MPPAEPPARNRFEDDLQQAGCRFLLFTFASGRGGSEAPFNPLERMGDRVGILNEHHVVLASGERRRVAALGSLESR